MLGMSWGPWPANNPGIIGGRERDSMSSTRQMPLPIMRAQRASRYWVTREGPEASPRQGLNSIRPGLFSPWSSRSI